jgi:isopentenyl diphosphate isomerase/L-lactate dehydrogenase-like FMN-dependent dehydrogenase
MLVDTNSRNTATSIVGHKVSTPFGFTPIGIIKIYNPLGELPVAKVAQDLNLPYCLSTAGSTPSKMSGGQMGRMELDSSNYTCGWFAEESS